MLSAAIIFGFLMGIPASTTGNLHLHDVNIDFKQYVGIIRHPLLTPNGYELDKGIDLTVNVGFWDSWYWKNNVDTYMDKGKQSQFRTVAWESTFGVHLFEAVDLEVGHRSTHMLDDTFKHNDKPFFNEDWVGVKWYLHRRDPVKALVNTTKKSDWRDRKY